MVELPEESVESPEKSTGKNSPWYPGSIARLPTGNVHVAVRNAGNDWLVVIVNEDTFQHMGVVVAGLDELNGKTLNLLYEEDSETIAHGELMVRMQPYEVKVFTTGRHWESPSRQGRDYEGE
ncbi:MAG: hypothetical protein ABIH23_01040 [bacterium]